MAEDHCQESRASYRRSHVQGRAAGSHLAILIMYRTHHCNELRVSDIGKEVLLSGWVDSRRDHGGVIFIDLRDREGLTQVVFRPEEFPEVSATAHTLRSEDVVQVKGQVAARLEGTRNSKIATGDIEVV